MNKPNSDPTSRAGSSRLREFLRQDRESGTHPVIKTLRSRPKERDSENRKAVEYVRIARGRMS